MLGKWIGRYKLSGEVGFGGMGAVYQATDTETGQLVAVKLLSQEYLNDLGLRAAFEHEAQLVTSLTHEAIVPVYEFGQEGGQPYLVMQYMTNGSLADRLLQGALSPEDVTPILDRLARAIDYAHDHGIIHRDLKPSNVLFDESGQAYLADFGIAWQQTSHQASSPFNGTPAYLSPEQALGDNEVDDRCDIYALGVILFETLTGRLPFEGQIPVAVILKQIHDQAPSLCAIDWSLPPGLDMVVQQALAKEPAERFSTACELASTFRLALSGELDNSRPTNFADPQVVNRPQGGFLEDPEIALRDAAMKAGDLAVSNNPAPPGPNQIDFFGPWQASISGRWRLAHLMALSVVTFIGILLAAVLTAFLYLPQPGALLLSSATGFQLSFDRTSLVLTNHTQTALDLSGLSFRQISVDGSSPVEFQASSWVDALSLEHSALPSGSCIQLLLPDAANFSLKPGRPLPDIPGCANLQGWLVVPEPQSWFWVSDGENNSFEVILNGAVVQTCRIANGSCRFIAELP